MDNTTHSTNSSTKSLPQDLRTTPVLCTLVLVCIIPLLFACGERSTPPSDNNLLADPILDLEPFIQMAANASCADQRNQLYIIDDQLIFWTTEGHCDDAGYAHAIFGKTLAERRCYLEDSFVGPLSSCEPELETLFDTLLQNLGQPDLGLGGAHTIKLVYPQSD